MQRKLHVLLPMGFATPERDFLIAFNRVAVARNWVLHIAFTPEEGRGVFSRVDAVVIHRDERYLDWLKPARAAGCKIVLVGMGSNIDDIPSVRVDQPMVGRLAADHLLGNGLRSLAVFNPIQSALWSQLRVQGFQSAAAPWTCHLWQENLWRLPSKKRTRLLRHLAGWLRDLPKPVGLFAVTDMAGWDLARLCCETDIRVPDDVAIVGVDNDELLCAMTNPPLSSVRIPWERLGDEAARLLVRRLSGQSVPKEVLVPPAEVVARQSTDICAVADPHVAAALMIIRRRAHEPLTVQDILQEVPVYQHRLQRGFRQLVGRTMLEEIRRVRIERARHLLATTDMTMAQVAKRTGFASNKRFSEEFRRETALRPSEYRQKYRLAVSSE
jgi:LacI family transcriptional regulator